MTRNITPGRDAYNTSVTPSAPYWDLVSDMNDPICRNAGTGQFHVANRDHRGPLPAGRHPH